MNPVQLAEAMFTADGRHGWHVLEPPYRDRWIRYATRTLAEYAERERRNLARKEAS